MPDRFVSFSAEIIRFTIWVRIAAVHKLNDDMY